MLGGQSAWVENECAADWAASAEISSEMDWLRFLWRFVHVDGYPTPKATLLDIMKILELADVQADVDFAEWDAAVCNPANTEIFALCDRFQALAADNGVDNGS